MTVAVSWQALLDEVPRVGFIPDSIWVDNPDGPGFTPLVRRDDPAAWTAAVAANAPVITQIAADGTFPTSSCSQPSIVADMLDALDPRPGDRVLEIGTGTGWNAALLARRVGPAGHVTTIEVDPALATDARQALTAAGYPAVEVIAGDGETGHPANAPFDRIISTASVRELLPQAWLTQLRSGGRLVTPWGTDFGNGALLTLDLRHDGTGTGRFSGNLAFMRLAGHRRGLFGWEPDPDTLATADTRTTDVRGHDLDRMFNPDKGLFAIGARLPTLSLVLGWDAHGERHHLIELDDRTTRSYARVDADLTSPEPFTVQQLGPRRLWDETETAYDWWYEHDEPGPDRLGLTISPSGNHAVWLDNPDNLVRTWQR